MRPVTLSLLLLGCTDQSADVMPPNATILNCGAVQPTEQAPAMCLKQQSGCTEKWAMATVRPGEKLASNGCAVIRVVGEGPSQRCATLRALNTWPFVEAAGCR